MIRHSSYRLGLLAELFAAVLLAAKGYRILAWRYRTPAGEIDLVARRGGTLVFAEVKARRTLPEALACVTPAMRGRIARAAGLFLARHEKLAGMEMRFDLIVLAPPLRWRHLDNAWPFSA